MGKKEKINILTFIIIIGFSISVFYHYFFGIYLGLGYPYNTFLFDPGDVFMDFLNPYYLLIKNGTPYIPTSVIGMHLPFTYILYKFFSLLKPIYALLLFIGIFIFYFIYYNYTNLLEINNETKFNKIELLTSLFIFSFMTYPFLFSIDRANIEFYLFIFLSLFIFFYLKNKTFLSNLFLTLAISMKFYALPFLLLYFKNKRYKDIFFIFLGATSISLISFYIFNPNILYSITIWLKNMDGFINDYAIGNYGWGHCCGLWGAIKVFLPKDTSSLLSALNIYNYVTAMIFGIISLYVIFIEKENWIKLLLIVFASLALPCVVGEYKLLMVYIPMWLFISQNNTGSRKFDLFFTICFGLLLIPKDYFRITNDVSISVILNPLILSLMACAIFWRKFIINNPRVISLITRRKHHV